MCADIWNESEKVLISTVIVQIFEFSISYPDILDKEQRKWTSELGKKVIATQILAMINFYSLIISH